MTDELSKNGKATLVLLSGGVDSTAMLYKYLTETSKKIHVHHIAIDGQYGNRSGVEFEHVTRIVNWLRANTRDFEFSYSSIEMNGVYNTTTHVMYAMMAALKCISDGIPVVASGRIATDKTIMGEHSFHMAKQIFAAATQNMMQAPPEWVIPLEHMCKRDIIRSIPRELFALTWSCQYPVSKGDTHHECRKCIGCARRTEGMIDSGLFDPIPEDVLASLNPDEYTEYVTANDYKHHPPLFKFHGRIE
jgi:7-cyano-7-deazaguanine synthase in queuosine biosynthesis